MFGGPRTGKTQWLAGRVLDAPGAVLVTSHPHRPATSCARRCAGERGPVFVFNAVGLAGLRVDDHVRPADRLRRSGGRDRAGHGHARRHLAERPGRGIGSSGTPRPAASWPRCCTPPRSGTSGCATCSAGWPTRSGPQREVPVLLRRAAEPAFEQDAMQFVKTNDRTRTSITSTIMPALGWLDQPRRRGRRRARATGRRSTSPSCSRSRATVFLLGAEETQAAPLVCALTGHIAREARRLAALQPGGPARPAADAGAGRGRADLPGAVGVVDGGHGRARGDDPGRVPVPGAAAGPVGGARRGDDPEQHRRGDGVRRHPRPRRPAVLVHPDRRARRAGPDHRPARPGRLPHGAAGAGAGAGADREPARPGRCC